jgi:hypothetical protein
MATRILGELLPKRQSDTLLQRAQLLTRLFPFLGLQKNAH